MCDRGDKGGGQHPCRLSQKPQGGLWGFPSVDSPCPGGAGSGLSCARGQGLPGPVGARFGSGGAACDAAALTSILCSAQGIKGQPGLCGEAARQLLLGQNMKGFYFPCPLWLLAFLPWGCRAGCGPGRAVQGPGGLWVLLLLLGSLSLRAVNYCFFGGCAFPLAAFAGVGAALSHSTGGLRVCLERLAWRSGEGSACQGSRGGQAGESGGATLMGSSAGCSSSSGMPLPRALAEMTSQTESPLCSQLLHPKLTVG